MGLRGGPKLKVLNPVIIALAVLMVDSLAGQKRSTKMLLHHLSVLKNPATLDHLAHVTVLSGMPGQLPLGAFCKPDRDPGLLPATFGALF